MVRNTFSSDKRKLPRVVFYFSILIAFFCDIKALNVYLSRDVDTEAGESGPMALMYMMSVLGIGICYFFSNIKSIKHIPVYAIFLLIWLIAFYMMTLYMIAPPLTSFVFFLVFTLSSFMIPFIAKVDGKVMLKTIMLLVFPAVFNLNEVFAPVKWYQNYISMGVSYSFLMPVVSSIVYMFCYFDKESKIEKTITLLGFAVNMVFAYYLITKGSRGPVLAILSMVVFLIFFKKKPSSLGIVTVKGTYMWFGIAIVFLWIFLIPMLNVVHEILSSAGISVKFISKFLYLNNENDITNGREIIYSIALADIYEKPLFGWGMDLFYYNHSGFNYPHNFLLQILYDGGILLFIVLVVPFYRGIKRLWVSCTHDEYAVYTVLFFGSVPGALFSDDLWKNCFLWLLFGALLSKNFVARKI